MDSESIIPSSTKSGDFLWMIVKGSYIEKIQFIGFSDISEKLIIRRNYQIGSEDCELLRFDYIQKNIIFIADAKVAYKTFKSQVKHFGRANSKILLRNARVAINGVKSGQGK